MSYIGLVGAVGATPATFGRSVLRLDTFVCKFAGDMSVLLG
jgi:hypothetical protein